VRTRAIGHGRRANEAATSSLRTPGTYRTTLFWIVIVAIGASAVAPWNRTDWALEHTPTAAALAFLVWYHRRENARPLGAVACTLLCAFFLLHVVGAHHLYSRVPYEAWWSALSGEAWPWPATRNHYDRLVHFAFGVLVVPAFAELAERHITRTATWAIAAAVGGIVGIGTLYELLEWCVALLAPGAVAEAYNGQQGDPFDAQKDMLLGLIGALPSAAVLALRARRAARA
jgi:putative membrane protein